MAYDDSLYTKNVTVTAGVAYPLSYFFNIVENPDSDFVGPVKEAGSITQFLSKNNTYNPDYGLGSDSNYVQVGDSTPQILETG